MSVYKKFENLVDEAIIEAFESGLQLFLENIESDLQSLAMVEENGLEEVLESIFDDGNLLKKLLR